MPPFGKRPDLDFPIYPNALTDNIGVYTQDGGINYTILMSQIKDYINVSGGSASFQYVDEFSDLPGGSDIDFNSFTSFGMLMVVEILKLMFLMLP